jgi:hypothetical protein
MGSTVPRTLENKPMIGWNARAFKMLNCKTGRKIIEINRNRIQIRRIIAHDIMHQRRKESAHFDTG